MAEPPTYVTVKHRTKQSEFNLSHWTFVLLVLLIAGSFLYQAFSPAVQQERSHSNASVIFGAMANAPDRR
jgi:hypothetical protein